MPSSPAYAFLSPLDANTAANDRRFATLDEVVATNVVERSQTDRARTLLVVDAACDLPAAWLREHGVCVLPIHVRVDGCTLIDSRDEETAVEFFASDHAGHDVAASTQPMTPADTCTFLLSHLTSEIDFALQVSIASSRSRIYLNSLAAMQALTTPHNRARRELGRRDPLRSWVIDSGTGFTGQGVLVTEAVRLLDAGMPTPAVAARIRELAPQVHTLVVPKDLFCLYNRARDKGDRSLSWLGYNVAQRLDIKPVIHANAGDTRPLFKVRGHAEAIERTLELCTKHVQQGLAVPTICVSYAGPIDVIEAWPGFADLRAACEWRGVELLCSTMSLTGGVSVGSEAFSVAFATKRPVL